MNFSIIPKEELFSNICISVSTKGMVVKSVTSPQKSGILIVQIK